MFQCRRGSKECAVYSKGIFTERSTDVSRKPGSLSSAVSTGDHRGEGSIVCPWQTNSYSSQAELMWGFEVGDTFLFC